MTNPASTNDIAERWRPLTSQEEMVALRLLDDAWDLLLGRRKTLEADVLAGTVTHPTIIRVLCAMVMRVMRNPEGWSEEAIDDWRGKRAEVLASGELNVTPTELADLTPVGVARRHSVRLVVNGDA
jgi:hypothetical protein